MSVDKKSMLRLRLMHRVGLLGPLVRMHRRIEEWESAEPAPPAPRVTPSTQLRPLGRR